MWKTRTIQREPMKERWVVDNTKFIKWVHWRVNELDGKMGGEMLEVIRVDRREIEQRGEEQEVGQRMSDGPVPRRATIMRRGLETH